MTQKEKILKAMLKNKEKKNWTAKDFQYGEHFIGYEASARMSELAVIYKDILVIGKEGRFRTLSINWKKKRQIKKVLKVLGGK